MEAHLLSLLLRILFISFMFLFIEKISHIFIINSHLLRILLT